MTSAMDYEQLFHEAPCSYLITDEAWTITAANASFLAWTGYGSDDVIGTSLPRLMPIGDRLLHSTHNAPQMQLTGTVSEVSFEILDVEGRRRAALLTAVRAVRSDGGVEIRVIIFSAHERRQYGARKSPKPGAFVPRPACNTSHCTTPSPGCRTGRVWRPSSSGTSPNHCPA